MNYDKKVIETIFGTKKNLSKVIDDAIDKLEVNDVAPFSEGILQFLHHFQGIASHRTWLHRRYGELISATTMSGTLASFPD